MDKWYEDPVYIKMSDCPEIQGQAPELKHFHRTENSKDIIYDDGNVWFAELVDHKLHKVWLPTQAQLQEMVGARFDDNVELIEILQDTISGITIGWEQREYFSSFTSMEQLWLAFYMNEQYNKVWLDGRWLDINN